ncbi:HIT-like domain-containing protein [Lipomyces chichibuensis]|uniref:HIT-like domain-containing protein n=1 Tax=Lipomyces chichibuensis TaxID=1546026 RepID=UPI0033435624
MATDEAHDLTSVESVQLIRKFQFERVLNHDTRSKLINILGTIDSTPAIVIAEKTAFAAHDETAIANLLNVDNGISSMRLLDRNDIYRWYMAVLVQDLEASPGAKVSLIWPATKTHVEKYGKQRRRMIRETPELYRKILIPYIEKMRGDRIQWVYNILSHKVEADRIVYENPDPREGFILLPDLKWDRTTMDSIYLVVIVHRRDIASIRDLNKSHIAWLKSVDSEIIQAVTQTYTAISATQLRVYVHYLPSYYHFHIHVTNVEHDAGDGAAVGKAIMLSDLIARLEEMSDEVYGFVNSTFTYWLGENSEVWKDGYASVIDGV